MSIYSQSENRKNKIFSEALISDTSLCSKAEELKLFSQFIGSWKFDWIGYNDDGKKQIVKGGEWIFSWILEGRAIQDVWILPGRDERIKTGTLEGEYGTTLRHYDPELKKWRVIWIGPIRNNVRNLIAEQAGDKIVLSETPETNVFRKWIFSDINKDSFRWHEEISSDNGKTWKLTQEFFNRRTEN